MKVKKDVNRRQAANGYLLMGNRGWPGWKNDWGWWSQMFSPWHVISVPEDTWASQEDLAWPWRSAEGCPEIWEAVHTVIPRTCGCVALQYAKGTLQMESSFLIIWAGPRKLQEALWEGGQRIQVKKKCDDRSRSWSDSLWRWRGHEPRNAGSL